jgi:hypothetical protein
VLTSTKFARILNSVRRLPILLERDVLPMEIEMSAECCSSCLKEPAEGGADLLRCMGCATAWYCNKECQRAHWKKGGHREFCRSLRLTREKEETTAERTTNRGDEGGGVGAAATAPHGVDQASYSDTPLDLNPVCLMCETRSVARRQGR